MQTLQKRNGHQKTGKRPLQSAEKEKETKKRSIKINKGNKRHQNNDSFLQSVFRIFETLRIIPPLIASS
jgi:hypothetical protein